MLIKIEMLIIYGLLSGHFFVGVRSLSNASFVNYLILRVLCNEHEIRIAEPAC